MLLHELDLIQSAFTRMLFSDQASAVSRFEVGYTLNYQFGPNGENIPVEREIIRAEFPSPFLASAFSMAWVHIRDNDMENVALWTLRRVTVRHIPVQWIREDRCGDETYAVTAALHERSDQCDVCRCYAELPFASCYFCGDTPSWHHGRCCPSHNDWSLMHA